MAVRKITEELDFLQKKVASLREILKLYPDTVIKTNGPDNDLYLSHSINKDVDTIRFSMDRSWYNVYPSKRIGSIEISSAPEKFSLFIFYPEDMYKQMIVQPNQDNMRKQGIPETLIRDCDLRVISFIKDRGVKLSTTNIGDVNPDSTIGKLLAIL
jgi:hypothetical protein